MFVFTSHFYVIFRDENMYLMGYFTGTADSKMLFLKADNQFTVKTGGVILLCVLTFLFVLN